MNNAMKEKLKKLLAAVGLTGREDGIADAPEAAAGPRLRHVNRRSALAACLAAAALLALAGCGGQPPPEGSSLAAASSEPAPQASSLPPPPPPAASSEAPAPVPTEDGMRYTKEFGSYTLPTGWVENKEHSTDRKFFYLAQGTEEEPQPDNISVEMGTNKYLAEEHEQFRYAILNQLLMQIQRSGMKAGINGDGTYTGDNRYLLYVFTITPDDLDLVTTQYYIVGDYQYVLVHETAPKDAQAANHAAQTIVDSFTWA